MARENRGWVLVARAIDRSAAFYGEGAEPIDVHFDLLSTDEQIGLRVTFAISGDEVHGVTIASDGNLPVRWLRSLKLDALRADAFAWFRSVLARTDDGSSHPDVSRRHRNVVHAWASDFDGRPGRRKRPDVFYARIASWYVDCLGEPHPLRALQIFMEKNGEPFSESQLRSLLYEARRRDLLTQPPPGRAGGHLTPKAIKCLEEAERGTR